MRDLLSADLSFFCDEMKDQIERIKNLHEIDIMLMRLASDKCDVIAWDLVGDQKKITHLKVFDYHGKMGKLALRLYEENSSDTNLLEEMSVGMLRNFYIPSMSLLFRSTLESIKTNEIYVFNFPQIMARQERRKNLRWNVGDENCKIFFSRNHKTKSSGVQVFEKTCHDISAGGLSFFLNQSEKHFIKIGDMLEGSNLIFLDREIPTTLEVVDLVEIEPNAHNNMLYGGYRVCCRFLSILEKDEIFIRIHILDLLSKILESA